MSPPICSHCTSPDIGYTVCFVSQFSSSSNKDHHNTLKRVLSYFSGTQNNTLTYPRDDHLDLVGYTDSSYANNLGNRRFISRLTFFLAACPISWSCKKQQSVVEYGKSRARTQYDCYFIGLTYDHLLSTVTSYHT